MNNFINESKRHFTLDKFLLLILLAFGVISIVAIYLSAPLLNQGVAEARSLVQKQIMWYIIGFILVAFLLKIGVDRMFTVIDVAYWILMVFLFGLVLAHYRVINFRFMEAINGTNAWYQIPGIGSFQPSEFMKIVLIIKAANTINTHNINKKATTFRSDFELIFKMAKFAIPPLILIILQPDTGVPIVILFSLATMFIISGVRREWFIIIGTLAVSLLLGIVFLYRTNPELLNSMLGGGKTSYRLDRFYGWLDYEKYAMSHGYQLFQALTSIGTAGMTGHPLGTLVAIYPEAQTDFIFAVISQNFGFIGAASVVALVFIFDIKLISNTIRSDLPRERYMMMGIIGMIVFQHLENIGMILAVLPITGITLPFISYGGSSLMSYMIPIAVAFHMYSETQNRHRH
ncbi:FtsW/RodA/SpoVE family cell cycle protein [Erysipelothrix sp. HDW6C]|uniref:FtsW/RodA/SpoVE family cell cycle protein n=1 Tax=Erysipelothrix sp. HDW6C TaxID=2714930 RepID=UPI0014099EEE|nr:FtsW/RodA/SpoVE family cell cycle protein [Erysipelothrix sp. HDW6C]QIK69095.1 FtsW/RodA/SpoVE family cell cycle protein [Erysipelothrix sp. HDW6C]